MDYAYVLEKITNLIPFAADFENIAFDKALSIFASLIFVGAFMLQFFSIYRHGGRDAVVSMLTWLLVACLCLTVAGYYWQQERDFFQAVLLLFLTGGALSCFLVSLVSRKTLDQESARRKVEVASAPSKTDQFVVAAAEFRERLAQARSRKAHS